MNKLTVLITGANGLLGQSLRTLFELNNFTVIATSLGLDRLSSHGHTYCELDVNSYHNCSEILHKYKPSIIINAAAMTNVDECEKNQKKCISINAHSIENFIPYVQQHNAHFIQISTDMVFDGKKGNYNEDDICAPVNFYGFSKLEAEQMILKSMQRYTILRTSLLYDVRGDNFLTRMKYKLMNRIHLDVVDDQYRTPTYVANLATAILQVAEHFKYGIYHISSGEKLSIFDIVCNIVTCLKLEDVLMQRIQSVDLKQVAARPLDSSLSIKKSQKEFNFIPVTLNNTLNKIL